mgnify:CR=1 FL=1
MTDILKAVEKIIDYKKKFNGSTEEFTSKMKEEFPDLSNNQKAIFKMTCNGEMEIPKLKYMLSMVNKINKKEISEYDASVKVGEKLVDEYVKPNIK